MYKHLENTNERNMRLFAEKVFKEMNWGEMPVSRFKIGNTEQFCGYCFVTLTGNCFITVSSNLRNHPTEYLFWCSAIHELIHAYMAFNDYTFEQTFNHGKTFKNIARKIQRVTSGMYLARDIIAHETE